MSQFPRYRCHKEVYALKIKSIIPHGADRDHREAGVRIEPEDAEFGPIEESWTYFLKHEPRPGGYWVKYDDGYSSYSPAKAFEEGYTRV